MKALYIVFLVVHVFAAVLFVGAATMAANVFPRHLERYWRGVGGQEQVLRALARTTRGYGSLALLVPAAGLVLAVLRDRLTELWLNASLLLAAVAAYALVVLVRTQQAQLELVVRDAGGPGPPAAASAGGAEGEEVVPAPVAADLRRLRMMAGLFNVTWVVILVLMVWRPGGHV